jgi:hypothetical protein
MRYPPANFPALGLIELVRHSTAEHRHRGLQHVSGNAAMIVKILEERLGRRLDANP